MIFFAPRLEVLPRHPVRALRSLLPWFVLLLLLVSPAPVFPAPPEAATVTLTPEEAAFLKGRKIRLGVDSARPPFEFVDEQGAYSGICASFIKECCRRLGVELVVVPGLNVTQAMEAADAGKLELIPKVTPTPERGRHLLFTEPYVTFPSVIISRKDAHFIGGLADLQGLRVGVLKGLVVEDLLMKDWPALPLTPLPNIKAALLAVSTGQIDVFVDNLGTVSYNIDRLGLTNLKIAAPTPYNHDLAFGIRRDMPLLKSAMDKALASMSSQERAAIKDQWLAVPYQGAIDWKTTALIGSALALVILAVLAWNRRLRSAVKDRDRAQQVLKDHALKLEAQTRQRARISQIATELHRAPTLEDLGRTFLYHLAPLAGLIHAEVYALGRGGDLLMPIGTYGRGDGGVPARAIPVGHGLVGQCARDGQPILLSEPDRIPVRIPVGAGELVPRDFLVLPVARMGEVRGVLAVATPDRLDGERRELLEELAEVLALNLEILVPKREA